MILAHCARHHVSQTGNDGVCCIAGVSRSVSRVCNQASLCASAVREEMRSSFVPVIFLLQYSNVVEQNKCDFVELLL